MPGSTLLRPSGAAVNLSRNLPLTSFSLLNPSETPRNGAKRAPSVGPGPFGDLPRVRQDARHSHGALHAVQRQMACGYGMLWL